MTKLAHVSFYIFRNSCVVKKFICSCLASGSASVLSSLGICLLTVGSVGHCLYEKQQHNVIHSVRSLETICSTAWHSDWKLHYEHFRVFGCQTEDSPIWGDVLRVMIKIKHPVNIIVFGLINCDGDVILPFIFLHGFTLHTEVYIKYLE